MNVIANEVARQSYSKMCRDRASKVDKKNKNLIYFEFIIKIRHFIKQFKL